MKYFHCTGGRICDPDGKGDIGCFIAGTQPTPPKGLGRCARGDGDVGVVERERELEGPDYKPERRLGDVGRLGGGTIE